MSASGKMMFGDLPPSSSETFFMLPVAAWAISRPTWVEPVKAILSTSGCCASGAPVSAPRPVIRLTTPGGKPAASINCTSRIATSGVCSAGLSTATQPVASAGPSFHTHMFNGKFHGTIKAQTPTGSRNV